MYASTSTHSIKFDVPESSPIKGMTFYLDRVRPSENQASLNLKKSYLFGHNHKKTEYAKKYLSEMFKNREIRIVFAQREYYNLVYIDCIFIENLSMIRQVVDILKAKKVLTRSGGEKIDSFVEKMEVNLNYCSRVADYITDYQIACIKEKIEPFIGLIVQDAKNTEQALAWIKKVARFPYSPFTDPTKNEMALHEALLNVAKVYSSQANLEGTLAELYVIYLPSRKIIKKVILDTLNEGFAALLHNSPHAKFEIA